MLFQQRDSNYEMELDRQREIKMDAEREIESFNTLEAGNKGLSDGDKFDKVIDQLITDAKEISEDRNKSMLLTQNTVLELEKKVDDAQKEVDKIDRHEREDDGIDPTHQHADGFL